MITPARILNKYRSLEPYLGPVGKHVREALWVFCELHGFALISRIKTLESASEKVETGRFQSWAGIDDLVGLTVVVPTLSHEAEVLAFLKGAFDSVDIKKRGGTLKDPTIFRFDSTRFIGRLRSLDQDRRGPIHEIQFEVQVKSAFEHAWAVTTHALTYKSEDVSWSKLRLTAQLKAAVEQLDTLVLSFEAAAKNVEPSQWPEIQAKARLRAFFARFAEAGMIPPELCPKDWSRFIDNVYRLPSRRGERKNREERIVEMIERAFEAEMAAMGPFPDHVPRSISLWQLTFASLHKAGSIDALEDRWPLITPELEDLYPALRPIKTRFDYA